MPRKRIKIPGTKDYVEVSEINDYIETHKNFKNLPLGQLKGILSDIQAEIAASGDDTDYANRLKAALRAVKNIIDTKEQP